MQAAIRAPAAASAAGCRGGLRRLHRGPIVLAQAHHKQQQQQQQEDDLRCARRSVLLGAPVSMLLLAQPALAEESGGVNAARKFFRPDELTQTQAVVILLDAKSVLRDIAALAATPQDSQERFRARALWPGFAKRLREAGPATPVVAGLVAGTSDKEETISSLYGGKSEAPGLTDEVYLAFGRVLTISGRTIRPEAQADPEPSQAASKAVENLLAKIPKGVLEEAQAFRVKRAAASGAAP